MKTDDSGAQKMGVLNQARSKPNPVENKTRQCEQKSWKLLLL